MRNRRNSNNINIMKIFNNLGTKAKIAVVSVLALAIGLSFIADRYDIIEIPDELKVFKSTEYTKEATNSEIQALIESVEVSDGKCSSEYDRNDWEKPARKFEGQSIRNYTVSISPNTISTGDYEFEYIDPFTGKSIYEIVAIDYDHIIPLSYVNEQIGCKWSNDKKNDFSFDIEVGVNTHQRENRSKGAKGPSEYMPVENQEEYVYTWLVIAEKYDIPIKPEDMYIIQKTLNKTESVNVINQYK